MKYAIVFILTNMSKFVLVRRQVLKSYFVVLMHNYVLENYAKYDKNKAVIITKADYLADYVFSEYELKK